MAAIRDEKIAWVMKLAERLFHILALACVCGAVTPLATRSSEVASADLGASNPLQTIATAGVLGVVLILMLLHRRTVIRLVPGMWAVLALICLAVLSTTWSDYPAITVRRTGSLVTITLWAWYIAARYELREVIAIVRQAIWSLALLSLAVSVGAPGLGQGPDGWLGVFSTKNDLGMMMAMGAVCFFYTFYAELFSERTRFLTICFSIVGFLLCCGLLYFSQSRTAWLTGLVGLIFCVVNRLTHKRAIAAIIIWMATLLLLAPAVILAIDQLGTIATMLGKDSSLTGRVDLWLLLPSYIMQRPWLGHGFGAFWVLDSPNVLNIWIMVDWEPPYSHNGWLDLLLDLGVAGWSLVAIQVLMLLTNGIRAVIDGREPGSQFLLAATFAILIHNVAESSLVRPGISWSLLVIAGATLAKIGMSRRTTRQLRRTSRFQRRDSLASPPLG
jgi:O-antigen ligase